MEPTRPALTAQWEATDRHRLASLSAAGLLLTAVALATFGLPPVDLHGPLHWLGIMDPLCGGTRAARYAALGQWKTSWEYNPLGIVVLLGAIGVLGRAGVGYGSGRWLTIRPGRSRLLYALLVAVLVLLAVRQQLHADLLTQPR